MKSFEKGVLTYRKCKTATNAKVNILSDQQMAYRRYVSSQIYKDILYLQELINSRSKREYHFVPKIEDIGTTHGNSNYLREKDKFFKVSVDIYVKGIEDPLAQNVYVCKIPFMDEYCKLNVDGKIKAPVIVQRTAEDISYNYKKQLFNIAMPRRNLRLVNGTKNISMIVHGSKIEVSDVLHAMLYELDPKQSLNNFFECAPAIDKMHLDATIIPQILYDNFSTDKYHIMNLLKTSEYDVGDKLRLSLNETFNLKRAVNSILARNTCGYAAGTPITEDMVTEFIRAGLYKIYVRNNNIPTNYVLAEPLGTIPVIKANTVIPNYIRKRIPELSNVVKAAEDINLQQNFSDINDMDPLHYECMKIFIHENMPLTKELIDYLIQLGVHSVAVKTKKTSQTIYHVSFENEIIGNYTATYGQLGWSLPSDKSFDDYVCYAPEHAKADLTKLNVYDLIAIVNEMFNTEVTGVANLMDRDKAYLKKVMLIDEAFSECFHTAAESFVTYKKYTFNPDEDRPFSGLDKEWKKLMLNNKFIETIDSTNISAEMAQVNSVKTIVQSKSSIPDEQRYLSTLYYGRICPFETPASKQLGINNSKAIGARIIDGVLKAPYCRLYATANGVAISDVVEYLSVKDECDCRFTDRLSLSYDKDGNILNTKVIAKIPNPEVSDEPFIFATVNVYDLAASGNTRCYVDAFPEQMLSCSAALVPFIGCNDPTRISYGVSQAKQAIYLYNSEQPFVYTDMYRDMFEYAEETKIYAPCKGTVVSTSIDMITIESTFNDKTTRVKVPINLSERTSDRDLETRILVNKGDAVDIRTVLATISTIPQLFVVKAPFSGVVQDITDTAIILNSAPVHNKDFIDLDPVDGTVAAIKYQSHRYLGASALFANVHVSVGDYVHEGQILADTSASRGGIYTPARQPLVAYISHSYNYEDGVCITSKASVDYTSIITHKLPVSLPREVYSSVYFSERKYKKYAAPGDAILNLNAKKTHSKEEKAVKIPVKATDKVNGIPFGIIRDDKDFDGNSFIVYVLGFNPLKVGDKMSGRHGNKGVVSYCLNNADAPLLSNGRMIEIMLNPHGVPSRMNVAQLNDMHCGLCCNVLGIQINTNAYNGTSNEDIQELMSFTYHMANDDLDNNPGAIRTLCDSFMEGTSQEAKDEFYKHIVENYDNIRDWKGVFDESGSGRVYDPITGSFYENAVTFGYPTYFKLMQEADEKLNVRGGVLTERYARTSGQPQKDEYSAKGQRLAEMELVALAAYGATSIVDEVLNVKSDNQYRRVTQTLEELGYYDYDQVYSATEDSAKSVENLTYMLEAMGVKMEILNDDGTPYLKHINASDAMESKSLNILNYITAVSKGTVDKTMNKDAFEE